ncbi:DUF4181 domain-containing protein [Bacillus sp. B-jedd]|uniref:DUF4181 domain-containing protein n=1 Tax=Bacillus sp. B-jedd TaxID=1476857 RepID=UPI0005156368|nr:hypothetical protein BN1002_01960 [Bacillus sp. B-jedd]
MRLTILHFLVLYLVSGIISDWLLRKKLKIEKSIWGFNKPVNKFHKWIERILIVTVLVCLWFIDDTLPLIISFWFILLIIRASVEWKYERVKKEYILTVFTIFNSTTFLFIALAYFN